MPFYSLCQHAPLFNLYSGMTHGKDAHVMALCKHSLIVVRMWSLGEVVFGLARI